MDGKIPVAVLFLLLGCSGGSSPSGVIPEGRFADIYVALLERTATADTAADSSAVVGRVLSDMKITEAQFRTTVQYYSEDVQRWKEFYTRVIDRLEARQKKEREAAG